MGGKAAIDPGTSAGVSESEVVYPSVVCQAFRLKKSQLHRMLRSTTSKECIGVGQKVTICWNVQCMVLFT